MKKSFQSQSSNEILISNSSENSSNEEKNSEHYNLEICNSNSRYSPNFKFKRKESCLSSENNKANNIFPPIQNLDSLKKFVLLRKRSFAIFDSHDNLKKLQENDEKKGLKPMSTLDIASESESDRVINSQNLEIHGLPHSHPKNGVIIKIDNPANSFNLNLKQAPHSVWNSFSDLIRHIFIERCITPKFFSGLHILGLRLCLALLERFFVKKKLQLSKFQDLEKFIQMPLKKRSEEIFKLAYKQYFKIEHASFMKERFLPSRRQIKEEFESDFSLYNNDKKKYFLEHYFKEDFKKFNKNFVMDIVTQKVKSKSSSNKSLSDSNNWETEKKLKMPCSISKSFRFLFLNCQLRTKKLQKFLKSKLKNGFLKIMQDEAEKKLKIKIEYWKELLKDDIENNSRTVKKFRDDINKKGFKFIWRFSDYENVHKFIDKEISNKTIIQKEFLEVKKSHYSFK